MSNIPINNRRGGMQRGSGGMQRAGPGGQRGPFGSQNVGSNTGTGNSAASWGLMGDARPASPSEGRAQLYRRVGPADQQQTRTYDNGTALTFGPDDPVAEPVPGGSFDQQFLEVNAAVRDLQVTNAQGIVFASTAPAGNNAAYAGFRTRFPPPQQLQAAQYPDGTVYTVVPSRVASVEVIPHIRSFVRHSSDRPGQAHPGDSVDTRYGENWGAGNVARNSGDIASHQQGFTAPSTSSTPLPNPARYEDTSLSRIIREQDQTRDNRRQRERKE